MTDDRLGVVRLTLVSVVSIISWTFGALFFLVAGVLLLPLRWQRVRRVSPTAELKRYRHLQSVPVRVQKCCLSLAFARPQLHWLQPTPLLPTQPPRHALPIRVATANARV